MSISICWLPLAMILAAILVAAGIRAWDRHVTRRLEREVYLAEHRTQLSDPQEDEHGDV